MRKLAVQVAALVGIGLLPQLAQGQPPYGPLIDAFCTAQGRTPATPFADGKSATPLSECQLCHLPNRFNKRDVVQPNFSEFQLARASGDYSFFCPAAVPNQPPVLAPIGARNGAVGMALFIELRATDPEGGALRFSAANSPAGAVLDDRGDGTAQFRWMPAPDQVGSHVVTFMVADSGTPIASDSEQVAIFVGTGNRAPVLAPIGNRTYVPGVMLSIELSATDGEPGPLSFSVSGGPGDGVLVDRGDGSAQWTWLPPAGTASGYELVFSVSDAAMPPATDAETIVLSPGAENRPPVLAPIGDQRVRVGQMLSLDFTATDPDGDALAFSATGLPTGARFTDLHDGSAQLRWTPTPDQPGPVSVVIAVADGADPAEVDSEAFSIHVESAPISGGPLAIARAVWIGRRGQLAVIGGGAPPGESVAILDARSGALLGAARASSRGTFRGVFAPFLAPCEVSARALDSSGAALPVTGAPADCGHTLLTRVREVEWNCEHGELRVRAGRAPASGSIEVIDSTTGALLGSAAADHRGKVDARLRLARSPSEVSLTARAGDARFELGSFGVEDAGDACAESDEDDDEAKSHEKRESRRRERD